MFPNTHFPKAKLYWYKGQLFDWSRAALHPMLHGLHYGTSVFEGIRAYNTARGPAVFRLPEHIDRLFHSASVLRMDVPHTKDEVIAAIKLTMIENGLEAAYIRPLLFFSYGNLGLVPKASPVELTIGCWEWAAYLGEKADQGVCVYILPWRRIHYSQLQMTAKLGGVYVQSTICGLEARAQGCDEAVFLNLEGRIAEGPGENIFIVKDGVLKTNDKTESAWRGSPGRASSRLPAIWATRPGSARSARTSSSRPTKPSSRARPSRSSRSSASGTPRTRPRPSRTPRSATAVRAA